MALGLYKPGQGYWVRVMTAAMAGILILAASAWLWEQIGGKADKIIPLATYTLNLSPASGDAKAGQLVSLRGESSSEVGTARVVVAEPTSAGGDRLVIEAPKFSGSSDISLVRTIEPAEGSSATLRGAIAGPPQAKRLFEALYLQAGAVGVLMVLGTIVTYYLVGMRQGSAEFLIATDGEMKKVNWSTKKHIRDSTSVVILWAVLLAGGLFVIDILFAKFFQLIGVLQH